jgi:ADP-ribose pyrophosphatase YjhB (NUDIX family)
VGDYPYNRVNIVSTQIIPDFGDISQKIICVRLIMNMSTDIQTINEVNLVIFTVIDAKLLSKSLWDDSVVSQGRYEHPISSGLSLFVLTVPANSVRYPKLERSRLLPGGYLLKDETLRESSRRIAMEWLNTKLFGLRQLMTFDEPTRDPGGRVISFPYWAMVDFEIIRKILGGRDQIGLELVNSPRYMQMFEKEVGPIENYDGVSRFGNRQMPSPSSFRGHQKTLSKGLPDGQILGLDHDDIVFHAWRQLRHAFDSRLDPFRYLELNPLGEEFRLSQLQDFTEVCRGERLQRDFFRRQMLSQDTFLKPANKTDRSKAGKPAMLYSPLLSESKSSDTDNEREQG